VRVKFWGTRGTRPTPGKRTLRYGGNTTCIEVRSSKNDLLILDSGSGIAELGAHLAPEGPLKAHLLISHTHWDHIQGFPFFTPAFDPDTQLTVVGPAGSIKSLQAAFADQMDPAYFPLRLDEIPANIQFIERRADETFEVGTMKVTPHPLHHPIVTHGYKIEENGTAFVFATDNELAMNARSEMGATDAMLADIVFGQLVDWCQKADLLVHDAQYSAEEYRTRVGWGHSTVEEALALAERARVEQLAFFHHDPLHSDADIDALIEEALGAHRERGGHELIAFPAAEDQEIVL
jgi:phosphoribosyl 1,2-cyclic phosphodiesterase